MADIEKNILITPNVGVANTAPEIDFISADASSNAKTISLKVYPTSNGTLSFEGNTGQLFSITDSMSGTIFSVNDISGIPSIEVLDTGLVKLAQYSGDVQIGPSTVLISENYTTTTTNQITLDSFPAATYRTATYEVQMTSSTNYHTITLKLIHNGTTVYLAQYGEIFTNASLGTFDATITSGNMNLLFTPTNATTVVKLTRQLILV